MSTTKDKKKGHGEAYSRKKEQAIENLIKYRTLGQAAAHTEISEKTLQRWLKRADFQEDYDRARKGGLQRTVSSLELLGLRAVQELEYQMQYGKNPLKAAKIVPDMSLKFKKAGIVTEEIGDLEEAPPTSKRRLAVVERTSGVGSHKRRKDQPIRSRQAAKEPSQPGTGGNGPNAESEDEAVPNEPGNQEERPTSHERVQRPLNTDKVGPHEEDRVGRSPADIIKAGVRRAEKQFVVTSPFLVEPRTPSKG